MAMAASVPYPGLRQRLFIQNPTAMAEISDGRLILLVFGVHGVAERTVDHRSKVLRVERIQPEGRQRTRSSLPSSVMTRPMFSRSTRSSTASSLSASSWREMCSIFSVDCKIAIISFLLSFCSPCRGSRFSPGLTRRFICMYFYVITLAQPYWGLSKIFFHLQKHCCFCGNKRGIASIRY